MIVLIDDERVFQPLFLDNDIVVLRTSKDALEWLDNVSPETVIDQIWFDHDLGIVDGEKDTTIPVLSKLEELCFYNKQPDIQQVVVHTSNAVGGNQIERSLKRYFPTVRVFAGDYFTV